jgi:hypothetical protein
VEHCTPQMMPEPLPKLEKEIEKGMRELEGMLG